MSDSQAENMTTCAELVPIPFPTIAGMKLFQSSPICARKLVEKWSSLDFKGLTAFTLYVHSTAMTKVVLSCNRGTSTSKPTATGYFVASPHGEKLQMSPVHVTYATHDLLF